MTSNRNAAPPVSPQELHPQVSLVAVWAPQLGPEVSGTSIAPGNLSVFAGSVQGIERFNNSISGVVANHTNDQGLPMAFIENVILDVEKRGNGTGARLYRAFTRLAMEHGATHLGGVTSPDAVRTRVKVFGPSRIKYFDKLETDDDEVVAMHTELDDDEVTQRITHGLNYRKYLAELQRKYDCDTYETEILLGSKMTAEEESALDDLSSKEKDFYSVVDLRGLDTSSWELDINEVVEQP